MPYAIRKQGEKWITYNKQTGDVKGKHDTRDEALSQMRLLYHVEGGRKLTRAK